MIRQDFIYAFEILREQLICSVSRQLAEIALNWFLAAQRSYVAREDEIRGIDSAEAGQKEFGLKLFIPLSLTDMDQSWHGVAEKCFALSIQTSPPIFF
jgi:hypothetical protein